MGDDALKYFKLVFKLMEIGLSLIIALTMLYFFSIITLHLKIFFYRVYLRIILFKNRLPRDLRVQITRDYDKRVNDILSMLDIKHFLKNPHLRISDKRRFSSIFK